MIALLRRTLVAWLPFAVAITGLAALAYALDQSNLRHGADDPQIQLAEDAASRLAAGAPVATVVPHTDAPVDIARSLATFVIVYDTADRPVASTAVLDRATPLLPAGVSASARQREDRVTWQPRDGVRIAAVVVSYSGGTVVAGRSLREVEARADDALAVTGLAWLTCLALALAACTAVDVFRRRGYG
jgi:hypothetical protein